MKSEIYYPIDTRTLLIEALRNSQQNNGNWCDFPQKGQSTHISPWTTAEALMSLQINNIAPTNLGAALDIVFNRSRIYKNKIPVGWSHRLLENEGFGICVSADCITALILYGHIKDAIEPLKKLLEIQHKDRSGNFSGWGFTEKDNLARVTPTCWALRTLIYAINYLEEQTKDINLEKHIIDGVKWLIDAQYIDKNNRKDKGGWGTEKHDIRPNASATAMTILVLLDSLRLSFISEFEVPITSAVALGIKRIQQHIHTYTIENQTYKYWDGHLEVYGDKHFRGLGTPLVLMAFVKAIEYKVIDEISIRSSITDTVQFLINNEKDGWVKTPGRDPTVFDNVYWLLALTYFQEYHLKNSRRLYEYVSGLERKIEDLGKIPTVMEHQLAGSKKKLLIAISTLFVIGILFFLFLDLYLFSMKFLNINNLWAIIGIQITIVIGALGILKFRK